MKNLGVYGRLFCCPTGEVLDFFFREQGYMRSVKDIKEETGLAEIEINNAVYRLLDRGIIEKEIIKKEKCYMLNDRSKAADLLQEACNEIANKN